MQFYDEFPFGRILSQLRKEANLTLVEVASAAHISHSHLLRAENGERKLKDKTVKAILKCLLAGAETEKQRKQAQFEQERQQVQEKLDQNVRKLAAMKRNHAAMTREFRKAIRSLRASISPEMQQELDPKISILEQPENKTGVGK
jgi:transcriptional regulator with XRE-family HTH domain